jgi:hypothetical protein
VDGAFTAEAGPHLVADVSVARNNPADRYACSMRIVGSQAPVAVARVPSPKSIVAPDNGTLVVVRVSSLRTVNVSLSPVNAGDWEIVRSITTTCAVGVAAGVAKWIGGVALGSDAVDGGAASVRLGPSVGVVVEQPATMAITAMIPTDRTGVTG